MLLVIYVYHFVHCMSSPVKALAVIAILGLLADCENSREPRMPSGNADIYKKREALCC